MGSGKESHKGISFTTLLYGPPGTGKTELKHISQGDWEED